MRTLVTGGAGFIGSHLVDALVAGGHEVVVLDDLSTGREENLNPAADLRVADVADEAAVGAAVAGCEVVFHQGALGSVQRSVERPLDSDRANTHGTLCVLECSRNAGVRRVVYASSSSIYGGVAPLPTVESAEPAPKSPYAVTKYAGELYARVFAGLHGLETVSLRYFNVFGPRQRPDSQYAAVIPLFIDALRRGEPPTVHGDGKQTRDFTYVADAVAANLAAASAPPERCSGRVYNVAGGGRHTLVDLLGVLGEILGVEPAARHVDPRPGDVRHSQADISAARADLGYEPTVSFVDGLRETVRWFGSR